MINQLKPITLYAKPPALIRASDYDVAVGINQDMMNSIIGSIYQGLYSHFLKGSIDFKELRLSVAWDVKQPPTIVFTPSDAALAQLIQRHQEAIPAGLSETIDVKAALESSQTLTLEVTVPEIKVTVSGISDEPSVSMSVAVDVYCYVELSGDNKLSIIPFDAKVSNDDAIVQTIQQVELPKVSSGETCYEWEDLILFIVNNVVAPIAIQKAKEMLPVIEIPKLEYGDVRLAYLTLAIEDACIIATASVEKDKPVDPVKENSGPANWPEGGFFAVVSPTLLQIAAETAISKLGPISKSGEGHWSIFGYTWEATVNVSNPQVSLSGSDIEITFDLSGSAYASVHAWFLKTGIKYNITAISPPSIKAALTINERNEVHVLIRDVSTIMLTCKPSGDIATWITSTLLGVICNEIGLIVVPIITLFLKNLDFKVIDIPTITIQEFGSLFKITADNLNVQGFDDKLTVTGDIVVSPDVASQMFGGKGGKPFDDFEDETFPSPVVGIKKIVINTETSGIRSIQVTYQLSNGETCPGKKHGGSGGTTNEFTLEDDEIITQITGKWDSSKDSQWVDNLQFITNKGRKKSYGGSGGDTPFEVSGEIVGFFGRSGDMLDAIGMYYRPSAQ